MLLFDASAGEVCLKPQNMGIVSCNKILLPQKIKVSHFAGKEEKRHIVLITITIGEQLI